MQQESNTGVSEILAHLGQAIDVDGDFPTQAFGLQTIEKLTESPNYDPKRIAEIIIADPILAVRLLHGFNSRGVSSSREFETVSEAILHCGLDQILELFRGLVVVQSYTSIAQRKPIFLDTLRQSIIISLLTRIFIREWRCNLEEQAILSGDIFGLGPLLLSYYYPQVFQAATGRASRRNMSVPESIQQTLGIPPFGLSIGIAHSLHVPELFRAVLSDAFSLISKAEHSELNNTGEYRMLSTALAAAGSAAQVFADYEVSSDIGESIQSIENQLDIDPALMNFALEQLPLDFSEYCRHHCMENLNLPWRLQSFLIHGSATTNLPTSVSPNNKLSKYLDNISNPAEGVPSIANAITQVMDAIQYVLKYDRVLLMLPDPECKRIFGSLSLGLSWGITPTLIVYKVTNEPTSENPVLHAFQSGRTIKDATPLFEPSAECLALPVGQREFTVGVIYAERLEPWSAEESKIRDPALQQALRLLAGALHDVIAASA